MKENKNVMTWRITLAIMLIFGLGFTLGKVTSVDRLAKIEGYKVNINNIAEQDALAATGVATDGNATSGNVDWEEDCATSSNATSSNVETDEDCATSSNATSGNVENPEQEDEVIDEQVKVDFDDKEKIEVVNEEITEEHIKYIRSSKKDVVIDASKNTVISKELLSAISAVNKNTLVVNVGDNQFVFYGDEIETIADANVKMEISTVSADENISKYVNTNNGIVLSFVEGNKFPEGTIVRVKETDVIASQVTTDAKIYSYDVKTNTFKLVQTNIGKEDGYYNLKISGDSKYVLVNKETAVDEELVGADNDKKEMVEFVDSNMTYFMVIGASVLVIIVVGIILIANRGKQEIKIETPVTPETDKPIEPQTTIEEINVIDEKK